MVDFWKAGAAILLALILGLVLDKQAKDLSTLLTMAACAMAAAAAISYLAPVLDFLRELESAGNFQNDFLSILLKAVGIGVGGELIGMICTDAGKASLGKTLQMLGAAVILSLSVPVFRALLTTIRQILGA